jgi:hypothetical protein
MGNSNKQQIKNGWKEINTWKCIIRLNIQNALNANTKEILVA